MSNSLNKMLDNAKRTPIDPIIIRPQSIPLQKKVMSFLSEVRLLIDKRKLLKKQLPYPEGTIFQLGKLKVMLVRKTEYDVVDCYITKKLESTCLGCRFNKMIIEESFDMGGKHRFEYLHCCLEDKIYEELLGKDNLIEIPAEFRVKVRDCTRDDNGKCVGFQFREIN